MTTKEIELVVKLTVPENLSEKGTQEIIDQVQQRCYAINSVQDIGLRRMAALKSGDLLFLWNEVHRAGEDMRRIDPGSVFGSMTCSEVQSLADVFAAAGDQKTHDFIMESHAYGDDDPDDEHHDRYLEIRKNGGTL